MKKDVLHIYTRVSTLAQADSGTSLETQLEIGTKRANALGFNLRHWNEGGKSSHHENIQDRPVLFEMYEAIKSGEIKHLWIYDQSRISRNDQVASIFRYECNKQGVTLYTKDGQMDLSNPSEKLLKHLLDGIAEFDNSVRAERTRLGKLNRVNAGFWHGGPAPFGYRIENKKLVVEKTEAKWVKNIFDDCLRGVSILKIKKTLDSKGVIPRRKKGLWTLGSIQALLKNTHYIGHYSFKDKKTENPIEVKCPVIVDELVWKSVQQSRTPQNARTQQKNKTKRFYMLRDLMFCGHCGRPISGRIKEEKNEYLYYCPNKERDWVVNGGSAQPWKRGVGCGMARSLNIKDCDDLVWNAATKLHKDSSVLKEEVKKKALKEKDILENQSEEDIFNLKNRIKRLEKDLLHAQETQGTLEFNFLAGEIDKKVYDFAVKLAKEKIESVNVSLTNAQLELKGTKESKKWVDWVKQYGDEVSSKDGLSDEQKRAYLSGLIERINVKYLSESNEHQIEIQFHLPIVGDGIKYKDASQKSLGYKVIKGEKSTVLMLKKKDPRWNKVTPQQNHSVTVE